jgi:predicted amidohydrolase YtcJ
MAADVLLRVGCIHAMDAGRTTYRSTAVHEGRIAAISADRHGLDGQIGETTRVIDDDGLVVFPAFYDTHCHLREFARNIALVPVDRARTVSEFVALVADAARGLPKETWVQTSNAWHERNLVEERLPLASELDAAVPDHPVFCRRGGHVAVANLRGLALAGITRATPDPPGGLIGRNAGGDLDGMLEGSAVYRVAAVIPPLSTEQQLEDLGRATAQLASTGLASVRDPIILREDVELYDAARRRDALKVRCRLMLLITPTRSAKEATERLEDLAELRSSGDDLLRVWGIKLVMDGGAEGGALDAPYANDPAFRGHLNWDPGVMAATVEAALGRGWKVGTHSVGDRAVRTVLDAYEQALRSHPNAAPNTLALEHAFLANREQRARAIRMGVHVTVQHPLLYTLGAQLMALWGPERTRDVMPVREWLEEGGLLSGGTDYPVAKFEPLESIWGFATRETARNGI